MEKPEEKRKVGSEVMSKKTNLDFVLEWIEKFDQDYEKGLIENDKPVRVILICPYDNCCEKGIHKKVCENGLFDECEEYQAISKEIFINWLEEDETPEALIPILGDKNNLRL